MLAWPQCGGKGTLRISRLTPGRPLARINLSPLFLPVEQINKSMCQVDCSQETMTHFWHHGLSLSLALSGSLSTPLPRNPPAFPFASLQPLIKKTLHSWRSALPWGCLTALFQASIRWGMMGKCKVSPCVLWALCVVVVQCLEWERCLISKPDRQQMRHPAVSSAIQCQLSNVRRGPREKRRDHFPVKWIG